MFYLKHLITQSKKGIDLLINTCFYKSNNQINCQASYLVDNFENPFNKEKKKELIFNLKDESITKDKEKILNELSSTIKTTNKDESNTIKTPNKEDLKKDKQKTKPEKPKKANFLKRAYFKLEDNYYDFVEKIKITKLTDKIDKIIPSFILFILLTFLLLGVLIYFLWPGPQVWSLSVHVTDSSGSDISDAIVTINYKDTEIISNTTDVFGEASLNSFSSGKHIVVNVSKDKYISKENEVSLLKSNNSLEVVLEINTNELLVENNSEEKTRNISFVENNSILVVEPLSLTFSCSTPNKNPEPSNKIISTGKVTVKQVKGCGELKVSVSSDNYEIISNLVVPENDKVNLVKVYSEKGQLTIKTKNLSGNTITDALIKLYSIDSPATAIDESEFVLKTGNTDTYGRFVFDLGPGRYLNSIEKIGYLSLSKLGPNNVITNNNTTVEYTLLTAQELVDFNCSIPKYQPLCVNGHIDCNNPILQPFITRYPDGTCVLGVPGFIDVTIKDRNSLALINADISLLGKLKDINQSHHIIQTKEDTNHFMFEVLNTFDYRVQVSNTEVNGYIQPDVIDTNGIDKNIIVLLDFSSELNSGTVGVNVQSNGYNIANSEVYLFRQDPTGEVLVNLEPKLTNSTGDVNFTSMRAGREYYAFSIQHLENLQGTSSQEELDANDFLELDIDLENTPRILNLKVTPEYFDVNFFSIVDDEQITDFVVNELPDGNRQYIFTDDISQLYAILSADGYTTYQTEIIKIFPGQEVYKVYNLISLEACGEVEIELIGLYNASKGDILVNNIDFNNNLLDDEYKLRFKFISCLENKDLAYAHIRTGAKQIIDDDSLNIVGVYSTLEDLEYEAGYAFHGELIDWNSTYFNLYNDFDHDYSWNESGLKWVDIDFSDIDVDVLEFSVDFNFKADITQLSNYIISYRALAMDDDDAVYLAPTFVGYNNWSIVPEGYFYSKTNLFSIPFISTDYILNWNLTDLLGNVIEKQGDAYVLNVDSDYKYSLKFLDLKDQNKINKTVIEDSSYTNNHLLFNSYIYKDNTPKTIGGSGLNDLNLTIFDINSYRGYLFDFNSVFGPTGFFENGSVVTPTLNTKIYNNFAELEFPLYSYYSFYSNYAIDVITSDVSGNNNIYYGPNDINFYVKTLSGDPLSGVIIKYSYSGFPNSEYILGTTDSTGSLLNKNILVDPSLVGSSIYFIFVFDSSSGYNGCQVLIEKEILSGYFIEPNTLDYNADVFRINEENHFSMNSNDYNIVRFSGQDVVLEDININSSSEYINVGLTNNDLESINNLPKTLTSNHSIIHAPISLNQSLDFSGVNNINTFIHNYINLGQSSSGQEVIAILDNNADINIDYKGDINLELDIEQGNYYGGLYVNDDNEINLELINGLVNVLFPHYVITGNGDNLKINNIILRSNSSDINLDYANIFSSPSLQSYSGNDINLTPQNIFVYYKLFQNANTGLHIPTTIDFNILFGNQSYIFSENIYLDIYNKDDILDGSLLSGGVINCTVDSCNRDVSYKLTNNLKSWVVDINSIQDINNSSIPLAMNLVSSLPIDINRSTEEIFNLNVYSNYNYFLENNNLYYTNQDNNLGLNLVVKLKPVGNIYSQLNKSINIPIIVWPINQLPPELGIKNNVCIGSGYGSVGNEVFIFANCQEEEDSCLTGEDNLPKIKFCWSSFGEECSNISWSADGEGPSCISDSSLYNLNNKFYCDSSQMLLSVFSKLATEQSINTITQEYYIYLLYDEVSDDLIKDVIGIIDDMDVLLGVDPEFINTIKAIYSSNSNNIKITKDENSPGLYKVNVTYNVEKSSINIILELEQEIPSTDLSLFYYLPINGINPDDGAKEGYGIKINYAQDQPLVKVTAKDNKEVLLATSTTGVVVNANNYSYTGLDSQYFQNLQATRETLLDLGLINTSYGPGLDLTYSLSRPVVVYSKVGCLNNSFNYSIRSSNGDVIPVLFEPLITWDYNINNEINQADDSKVVYSSGYSNHQVKLSDYVTIPLDLNYSVVKSMIFIPVGDDYKLNPGDYKLSTVDLVNSVNTKLYNVDTNGTEINLISKVADLDLISIQDLFNLIKEEKACISNSLTSTKISWNGSKIGLSEARINEINQDAASQVFVNDCSNNTE